MLQLTNVGIQNTFPYGRSLHPLDSQLSTAVWIDANDYPVGTFANGAVITNKGTNGATFAVVGTTLAIQLNAEGKHEFVFDGNSYISCTSAKSTFTKYKNGDQNHTFCWFGKIGATANPDATYAMCGNSGASSSSQGMTWSYNNAVAASIKGFAYSVMRGVVTSFPISGTMAVTGVLNTRRASYLSYTNTQSNTDPVKTFSDGDMVGILDRTRTTLNTTGGLGTAINFSATEATYNFDIGATGNGVFKMVGKLEQFLIMDFDITVDKLRSLDNYFQVETTKGDSLFKYIIQLHNISDGYNLGGSYGKRSDKTKTLFAFSHGDDHFGTTLRNGAQLISTDDGRTWPSSFTFNEASSESIVGAAGGYTITGRFVTLVSIYSAGAFSYFAERHTDDDGTTWSALNAITIPVTSPALSIFLPHDGINTMNNGDISILAYANNTTPLYKVYLVRSTDDGDTWAFTEIHSGATAINEASMCWLGGNDWMVMARIEAAISSFFEYKMFLSDDDGATWTDAGNTNFDLNYVYASPPMVRSFLIDGTRVIELMWVNRGTRRWHVKYGLASGILSSGAGSYWDSLPLYTLYLTKSGSLPSTTTGWRSGYPVIIHPDNDLNSEGVWFDEIDEDTTKIYFFKINDDLKAKIKSDLGL